METQKDLADTFIQYLTENNYPIESIATEFRVGDRYRVDVAVVDPVRKVPIQIFELKSKKTPETIAAGTAQLQKYLSLLKNSDIPAYLVFPKPEHPNFEVFSIEEKNNNETDQSVARSRVVFNYLNQKNARSTEVSTKLKKAKDETADLFQWVCWGLALALAAIFILTKTTNFKLDTSDLAVLGGAVALVVIPFSSKLKILGVEFERESTEKPEGSKNNSAGN